MDPTPAAPSSSSTPPAHTPASRPQPAAEPRAMTIVVQSPLTLVFKALAGLLAVGLLISVIFNFVCLVAYQDYFQTDSDISEKHHSGTRSSSDKIAVISVEGVMMESDGFTKRQIDRVRKDDDVKAVVLRVDSPGGAVTAADYLFHHLKKLRDEKKIPIVVSMGSMAASGGYYVSMAVGDEERAIFAEPTTITGSIGVIIPRYDVSEALRKLDVKSDSIVSHELKEMGSWTKELTPPQRAKLQQQVDLLFERFKNIVKEGRPALRNDEAALQQIATGEVFTGEQAKDLMLVDEVGFIEDAIERAAEMASLKQDEYRVVEYHSPPSLADALMSAEAASRGGFDPRAIMEMTTPRAYYLHTWLPPVLAR
ncbi:MAG: signal peptide peptidase SppA [Planctomycetales bacterium]|nr:signal peptide peptidase SppA [Planctomycetales bacterium]